MLLTERGDTLLPPCAFFLQCFLNTRGLRPTASREDFYEGRALSEAREEFAAAVRRHLARLAEEDPDRLRSIVSVHTEAIKAMADRFSLPFQPLHEEEMFDTLEEAPPPSASGGSCCFGRRMRPCSPSSVRPSSAASCPPTCPCCAP